MTAELLIKATKLQKRIDDLERILECSKKQTCEWIEFTFGNGSSKSTVCTDSDIIKLVRELLIKENEQKLIKLQDDFKSL